MSIHARLARLEAHQVPLCLAAIAAGAALGWGIPALGPALEPLLSPIIALLLYATFLAVPLARLGRALRDWRFMLAILVVNFLAVPPVVWLLTRPLADSPALLMGALLVLLAPCVDYVIAFTALAGGARDRLLAAAPLLMLTQALALPVLLPLFAGPGAVRIEPGPFLEALVVLILLPALLAAATQWAASRGGRPGGAGRALIGAAGSAMVPLMMLTLLTVVASQSAAVGAHLGELSAVLPVFLGFLLIMLPVGALISRAARLDVPGRRAIIFSGATRNSLVVLPLALALPEPLALAALVVVTQTLVELIGMPLYVRLVPRLIRGPKK